MIVFLSSAPHVEFTKPLHDVEVKEKESARFECEVSRESAKVCLKLISFFFYNPLTYFQNQQIHYANYWHSKMIIKSLFG